TWQDTAATPLGDVQAGTPIGGGSLPAIGGQNLPILPLNGDPLDQPLPSLPLKQFSLPATPNGLLVSGLVLPGQNGAEAAGHVGSVQLSPLKAKPFELTHTRLIFCMPENAELLAYWDRVEDR